MDKISKANRSKIMAAIRSKHTGPELLLRKAMRKEGLHYRLHYGKERIDIALPDRRIAMFVDGCFWHQCPKHSHLPKSNRNYWHPKLKKNVQRAKEKDNRLKSAGWKVIHVWEHEVKNDTNKCVKKIMGHL